jgi:hypothetical protein
MQTSVVIEYEGLVADEGRMELFEASEAIKGLATATNLITHGFVHDDEVRNRVVKKKDFNTYLKGARKGCFEIDLEVSFEEKVIEKHGRTVIVNKYWDYLAYAIANAVGEEYEPQTPYLEKLIDEKPFVFDEMAIELERHLVQIHRPILSRNAEVARFHRPKSGDKIVLNRTTLEYVAESNKSNVEHAWIGNVTRYNILTGAGRVYIDDLGRTVPFKIVDHDGVGVLVHKAAAASINEGANWGAAQGGKRVFHGYETTNAKEIVKRIEITGISQLKGE